VPKAKTNPRQLGLFGEPDPDGPSAVGAFGPVGFSTTEKLESTEEENPDPVLNSSVPSVPSVVEKSSEVADEVPVSIATEWLAARGGKHRTWLGYGVPVPPEPAPLTLEQELEPFIEEAVTEIREILGFPAEPPPPAERRPGGLTLHPCGWPGCPETVPAMHWGCLRHTWCLPAPIRHGFWNPPDSAEYADADRAAQAFIAKAML
jgi:hypothetical protein